MVTFALGLLATTLFPVPPDQPVVLAKGDGYVVHALRGEIGAGALFGQKPPTAPHILHAVLPGGKLTVLFRSGTTIGPSPPLGYARTPFNQMRVVGVASDAERLYVLVWSAKWTELGDRPLEVKPSESDDYTVRVYWLEDGTGVGAYTVGGTKRPRVLPRESVEVGPLVVEKDGGVSVYGETFRFQGKERAK